MNAVEQRVLEWLEEKNIKYEKTETGFMTPFFHIKCVPWNQETPVYKEGNERIIFDRTLDWEIKNLNDWFNRKPTLRIEKLNINSTVTDSKILVIARSKLNDELVAEAEFWIEPNCIFWADTRYHNYIVPGWLSKVLKTVLRLNIDKDIEVLTNAIDGAYQKIGFKTVEQVDVNYFYEKMGREKYFKNPENILIWRLRYDSVSAV